MIDGDDLKAVRVRANITQQMMARKLDVDRKTIINYELGVSDIPAKKLFRWLQCCKLDLAVLFSQIKTIREEANSNGKAKLLDIVTVAFIFSQLWNASTVTYLYLLLLGGTIAVSTYTKNINMAHISGFILVITGLSTIIFETGLINVVTPEENALLQSSLIYGTQLLLSLLTVLVLIFRVQLSRLISTSNQVKHTHYDGIFHWVYLYMTTIYLLAFAEDIAFIVFDMTSWTLIYDNFEALIYLAWALCCVSLLTMMICEAKSNHSDKANAL